MRKKDQAKLAKKQALVVEATAEQSPIETPLPAPKGAEFSEAPAEELKPVKAAAKTPAAEPAPIPTEEPAMAPAPESFKPDHTQLKRNRLLINMVAAAVVIVAAVLFAIVVAGNHTTPSDSSVKSGQSSPTADKLLESGGTLCSTGANPNANNGGSPGAQSTGTYLQSGSVNDIQTPEGVGTASSDLNTFQPATCF